MGEVTIPLSQWFPTGEVQLWSDNLPVRPDLPRLWFAYDSVEELRLTGSALDAQTPLDP